MTDRSGNFGVEPLLNDRGFEDSTIKGLTVRAVSEVGKASNRTAIAVNATAQAVTIGANKNSIEIQNVGSNTIYLGGSGVDSTNGYRLYSEYVKTFNKVKSDFSIYVVCASGQTSNLVVIEYE